MSSAPFKGWLFRHSSSEIINLSDNLIEEQARLEEARSNGLVETELEDPHP